METVKRKWKKLPDALRKPLTLIVGTVIIIGGLLLVPLPGPGWLIVFFGFAVLATEFAFAERLRAWIVEQAKASVEWSKTTWHHFTKKLKNKR